MIMKYWFYVEGDSEQLFIEWLIRKCFHNITLCKNLTDFVKDISGNEICYIYNCESVNKVPYEISERNHWVERSGTNAIFVICDIEAELNCPIERRKKILDIMQELKNTYSPPVNEEKLRFIFCDPTIEELYCYHADVTKSILEKLYKRKFGAEISSVDIGILGHETKSPVFKMKSFFLSHGLTYKETEFAENFFPQLDYESSGNKTIKRLVNMTKKIFNVN